MSIPGIPTIPTKFILIAVGVIALGFLLWLLVENLQDSAEESGSNKVKAEAASAAVEAAETANESREATRNRTDEQQRADCRLYARNPDDC